MKRTSIGIALAICLAGCTTPGELTQAKVGIVDGKKSIRLESHKDTIIEDFERSPDGTIKIHGYKSVANQGAIEASTAQAQMLNNLMLQNAEMVRQFGGLAAQFFSGGAVRTQPQTGIDHPPAPNSGSPPIIVNTSPAK